MEEPLFKSTPTISRRNNVFSQPQIMEYQFATVGLIGSLVIIALKLLFSNVDFLQDVFVEHRLITSEVVKDGQILYEYAWKNVIKYSDIWVPILCGSLATSFTWILVYLDSHVPGVQPPSPFSPEKYKKRSGHSFHLNYVFAVLVGISVAGYMFLNRVNIQY